MTNTRRAEVLVTYQEVDITQAVQEDLLSFNYVDNASGVSDSVSLTLKDDKRLWVQDWFPQKNDIVTATLQTRNWRRAGDRQRLPCGRFFIDNPEYAGRPSTFTINGVAAPLNKKI